MPKAFKRVFSCLMFLLLLSSWLLGFSYKPLNFSVVLYHVPNKEKMVESLVSWFGHVTKRSKESLVIRVDQNEVIPYNLRERKTKENSR